MASKTTTLITEGAKLIESHPGLALHQAGPRAVVRRWASHYSDPDLIVPSAMARLRPPGRSLGQTGLPTYG